MIDTNDRRVSRVQRLFWMHKYLNRRMFSLFDRSIDQKYRTSFLSEMFVVIRSSQKSVITIIIIGLKINRLSFCMWRVSRTFVSWTNVSTGHWVQSIIRYWHSIDRSITCVFDNGNQVRLISHLVDTCLTNVEYVCRHVQGDTELGQCRSFVSMFSIKEVFKLKLNSCSSLNQNRSNQI